MILTEYSKSEIDEMLVMLDVAEKVIETQRKILHETYGPASIDDSATLEKYLPKWDAYIRATTPDPGRCPALSPQSRRPCELKDFRTAHRDGHRVNSGVTIAWAVTEEDRIRWR